MALTTQERTNIIKLVVAMFNAAPGATYLADLTVAYEANGRSLAQLARTLTETTAYKTLNPVFQTASEFATALLTPLGLQANATAVEFVTAKFNAGISKGQIAYDVAVALDATTATEFADAKAILNNKTTVAEYYSVTKAIAQTNVGTLQQSISTVTKDASSVTTAQTNIDNGTTGTSGSSFVFTTGVDSLVGTSGNDTFTADNTTTSKQLSVVDTINGASGTDTLKVFLATGDTAVPAATLNSVETLYVNGGAVTALTLGSGQTKLEVDAPVVNTAATYTLGTTGQSISLANHTVTANTTTTIANGASNADTALNLTVNTQAQGGTGATWLNTLDLSGTKVATLNLATTGAASKFTLTNTGAALATINVSGDKGLTLTESLTSVKTVNASTATGAVALDVSGATVNVAFAFTGGTAGDTLTVAAGQLTATTGLTSGAQIDFGAGTDTLVIKDTTPVYSTINAMKNLEVLRLGVTAATASMSSLTSVKTIAAGGIADATVSNAAADSVFNIVGAITGTATIGGAVGNNASTINVGSASAAGFTVNSLVTTGLTTIALSSNGTSANTITSITNSENSNFTITGAADLTLALTAGATVTGSVINGAAFTGKLTATTTDQADVLTGGTGADTLTAGKGADKITGGAGADTFVFSGAAGATTSGITAGDEITDFVAGTDKLQFTGVTDVVSAQQAAVQTAVTALAAGSTAAQIATAMATANTTNLGVSFAVFNGNTYVLFETTGASTGVAADDVFIKLTGVTTLPTFATDVTP